MRRLNKGTARRLVILGLFLLGGHFTSCEPEDWLLEVDCYECFDFRPDSAVVIVYLSIDTENPEVPLTFYRGDAGGELEWQDTAFENEFRLPVAVGPEYTVKAQYRREGKIIEAFDSDDMVLKDYGESCGDPCYILKGGIFDLRLYSTD